MNVAIFLMSSFERNLKDLNAELARLHGNSTTTLVISFNALGECMNLPQFFERILSWKQRSEMLEKIFQCLVNWKCIVCLQEIDEPIEKLLLNITEEYTLITGQGFRFKTGIYAPRNVICEQGSVEGSTMPIPEDAVDVMPGLAEEWLKRTTALVHIKTIQGFYIFTTHYPLSLALPSLKVLYTASIIDQIKAIAGSTDHLLLVDANTLPTEQTFDYLTVPGFRPTGKYLPWTDFPALDMTYYVLPGGITNHAKAPERPAFSGRLDYVFISHDMNSYDIDHISQAFTDQIVKNPLPDDSWPSDHTLIAISIKDVQCE